jgi:beta-phosphoglucomutase family hydrolase
MKAIIFDLDGVITKTATVHSKAWKKVFDEFLIAHSEKEHEPFVPFDRKEDYLTYVDGKPRYDGVRSFLKSREIFLPEGTPDDDQAMETICGLGNRKNEAFNQILEREGVEVYGSTVELIRKCRLEGIRVGVASSSKNCRNILEITGIAPLIETRVDGEVSAELGLKGKPAPDIFWKAADNLGIHYGDCVIVEDATSGVEAGARGNFGMVIGVARENNWGQLTQHGADQVVSDLSEISYDEIMRWFREYVHQRSWDLTYRELDFDKQRSREALLSVGNGYFGTRGAAEELICGHWSYPGTYISGVYNTLPSKVAGKNVFNEDFVNVTNWLPITFKLDDLDWVIAEEVALHEHYQSLNFHTGELTRQFVINDKGQGLISVTTERIASMEHPHLAALRFRLDLMDTESETITIKTGLEGNHINDGVERYRDLNQKHLQPVMEWYYGNFQHVEVETTQSDTKIAQTARVEFLVNGKKADWALTGQTEPGVSELITEAIPLREIKEIVIEKYVYIDAYPADESADPDTTDTLNSISSYNQLRDASFDAWKKIWDKADIFIGGDRLAQKLVRLHIYHLMCTTSHHTINIDCGIPARGLTGEAYRGHIFWDEMYILPFYFLHFPDIARGVLMYRYRRLDAARAYAAEHGYQGAMFPWQSGSTGKEETQKFHFNPVSGKWGDDNSSLQRHVSLAVAWNIIQYHHHTFDEPFMLDYGFEMLLEISRFWSSKCILNPETGRYSINKVMGPDEFHEKYPGAETGGLRDNAYTNVMTAWLFTKVYDLLEKVDSGKKEHLLSRLDFSDEEVSGWVEKAGKLNLVISDEGIISQFDGYFELEEIEFDKYRKLYGNIHRLDRILKAEGKSPDQFKVAKQADTLMLFYVLKPEMVKQLIENMGYQLPDDFLEKNFDYYIQRTSHGSTLSRVVHGWVAGLIGRDDLAWQLFREALVSDYDDIQGGTTAEGIHTGVMAGTVMAVMNLYGGVDLSGEVPVIKPRLPKQWNALSFQFTFRNETYQVNEKR